MSSRGGFGSRLGSVALVAVPSTFLGYFFVYPLIRIIVTGLTPGGTLDAGVFGSVLTDPTLLGIAWFTLWQAVASTLLTLLVALPGAYVFARFDFPGRKLLRAGVTVPFVLPTVVVGSAFLALLGSDGVLGIDLRRTVWAILVAHVFFNYAVVVRTVGTLWERLDVRLSDAARTLGASPWHAFREVTLPLLAPAIASAASLVFLFTFTSFGVVLILGGLRYSTIEVEIWRQTTALLDLPVASVLAVLQLLGVGSALFAYSRLQERRATQQNLVNVARNARRPATTRQWLLVGGIMTSMVALLASPLAVLVVRSFRIGGSWSLEAYRTLGKPSSALFVPATEAIRNSIVFAAAATALALFVGMLAAAVVAYRRTAAARWFDAVFMLPLGTSAVTIGFGFLIALDRPVDLRTSAWLIPIAHALVAVPFVIRTTVPVLRSIKVRLREAAAVLGAAPVRVWREVDLPIVARAALVGAGFAFAVSVGEFGATAFIARPDVPTLPVAIYRLLSRPGSTNFAGAMALSTILMVLTTSAIFLIERIRAGETGDF